MRTRFKDRLVGVDQSTGSCSLSLNLRSGRSSIANESLERKIVRSVRSGLMTCAVLLLASQSSRHE